MMTVKVGEPRPLIWRGASKAEFMAFPVMVQREMGYALFLAQMGERHSRAAKTLTGFGGAAVVEIRESHDRNTYRAVYATRCICAACLPEEIEERHRHAEAGCGSDQAAIQRGEGVGGR